MTENPFAAIRRERKVAAMVAVFWAELLDSERCNPEIPAVLAAWCQAHRDGLAEAAGVNTPSAKTWNLFVDRIALMVEQDRIRARAVS